MHVPVSYLGWASCPRSISDEANLTTTAMAIMHIDNVLLVDIQVEGISLRDNSHHIRLVRPFLQGRRCATSKQQRCTGSKILVVNRPKVRTQILG